VFDRSKLKFVHRCIEKELRMVHLKTIKLVGLEQR
jgi:hypothetical protein